MKQSDIISTLKRIFLTGVFAFVLTSISFALETDKPKALKIDTDISLESEIDLENWMLDLHAWDSRFDTEEDIMIEDWMLQLNHENWKIIEPEIELENWMTDLSVW